MLSRFNRSGTWTTSSYSDIPTPPDGVTDVVRNFYVIAGGLALVLSRTRTQLIDLHFRYTRDLYDQLRDDLRAHGKTNANAKLINEVMHEVAQCADPETKAALRFVFAARCEYERNSRQVTLAQRQLRSPSKQTSGIETKRPRAGATSQANAAESQPVTVIVSEAKQHLMKVLQRARSAR